MRVQTGQSTLEYLALVLLAILVLGAGVLAASRTGIAQAFTARIQLALCTVGGGPCGRGGAPCVVAFETDIRDAAVRLAVVRLSGGRTVLRQRRSDGTELLTVVDRSGAGLGVSAGIEASLGTTAIGGTVGASIEGRSGAGRAWIVRSDAEARELLRRLSRPPTAGRAGVLHDIPPPPRAPDVRFGERGLDVALDARLGRVGLRFDAEDLLGSREDRLSGERTFTIRRRNELLAGAGILGDAGADVLARREERYALTVDVAGDPVDLAVIESHTLRAGVRLPGPLGAALGARLPPTRRARVVESERHLDLTDPVNLAAASAYVRALREPRLRQGDAVAISQGLRERLDAAGSAQARVYDVSTRQRGASGGVSVGGGIGGAVEQVMESARLVGATWRGEDGVWRDRDACLRAAGRA